MGMLAHDLEAQALIGGLPNESAMVGGAYEAASRFEREVAMWSASGGSADQDILGDKDLLDWRTRDAVRNDAYVHAAMDIRKDNIVGSMYMLNSKPECHVLGLDDVWAEEYQQEVEAKFTLWSESIFGHPDASRALTLTGITRLGVGLELMAGEVLIVGKWIEDAHRPFSTAVQIIDTDRLSNPPEAIASPLLRGGVQKNRNGEAIGYHIRRAHPYDPVDIESARWDYEPAKTSWGRQNVIHIREMFRPDQTRGISAMVAGLEETRIGKKFRRVVLQNAVVNATYAASIESELPTQAVFEALGAGKGEDVQSAITKYAAGYLGALNSYMQGSKNTMLNGVRIPHLFPGTKFQLRPAGQGGPLGTEFEQSILRYLAALLGVSYEQLSRDYSKTNYSSAKAALNETWKGMLARKRIVADTIATHIFLMWLEEAFAKGEIASLPRNAPNFWEGLNREAYGRCDWIGASRGQIDELKETQAAVLRLKSGLSTREDELGRLGKDWRKVLSQLAREQKEADRLGLNFTENDPSLNAASGTPREEDSTDV